jgi:branched-chain amino acid transport system ATP-binding protein
LANLLEVKGVTKSFGNLRALDDVTLGAEERKVSILIGPNGSGKTTLINVVSGFYNPDSGSVLFGGRDITQVPPHRRYAMGLARTFQIPNLFWKLTVLENVMVAEGSNPGESFAKSLLRRSWINREKEATERALKLIELLGLGGVWDRPALNLSGGQMKLLEMGRVLMSGAKLILLDEPISGVNPTLAHEIFARILKLRDDLGITFYIIEHRLDIAMSYVDNVTAMAFGKVIAEGKPESVLSDAKVVEAYLGA